MPLILLSAFASILLILVAMDDSPPERKCIDGVEYFVSSNTGTPTAAVVDASTKAPKLCEVKNVPVQ